MAHVWHLLHRSLYRFWTAFVLRAGYVFMRLTEPWTPYVRVHGLRLLPCNQRSEEGVDHMRHLLNALHDRDPAALAALPQQLRYFSTVDGDRQWAYQHIPEMRILRWSMQHLEAASLDERLAVLQRLANTGCI